MIANLRVVVVVAAAAAAAAEMSGDCVGHTHYRIQLY
jgi:hypothetical protein